MHRIENHFKKPVKIMEVQTGTVLKETDIVVIKIIYINAVTDKIPIGSNQIALSLNAWNNKSGTAMMETNVEHLITTKN